MRPPPAIDASLLNPEFHTIARVRYAIDLDVHLPGPLDKARRLCTQVEDIEATGISEVHIWIGITRILRQQRRGRGVQSRDARGVNNRRGRRDVATVRVTKGDFDRDRAPLLMRDGLIVLRTNPVADRERRIVVGDEIVP